MVVRKTRRTAREGREFRLELVEAAKELFIEQGFDAVSIRKITERAGCSPMNFYVYFRNKRELLRHIWEDILVVAAKAAAAAAEAPGDVPGRLAAFVRAWTLHWIEHPDNFRIVFLNQDRLASDDDLYFAQSWEARRFPVLVGLIERGIADGSFGDVDPLVVAQSLLASSVGLACTQITIPEVGWHSALTDATVDLLVQGLRATATR